MANSEAARGIPHELVEEILSFMPVKDLLRFRCVSKSWRNTISSPIFRLSADRTRRSVIFLKKSTISSPPPFLDLIEEGKEAITITPWSEFDLATFLASYSSSSTDDEGAGSVHYCDNRVLVLGSYDGLLLLGHQGYIFLFNPSTRQCKKIAPYQMYGAFDFVCCGGMCYDPSNNDYQFVLAIEPYIINSLSLWDDNAPAVRVITFKAQMWEEVEFPYDGISWIDSGTAGVVVDEKIHWLVYGRSQLLLVCFDAANNGFVELPKPEHLENCWDICGLGVLDGCLAISSRQRDGSRLKYHVWVMKEYGVKESWTLLLTLDIPNDDISGEPTTCKPLFITSYGEVVINLGARKMIAYDLKNHCYREIVLPRKERSYIECAIAYEESLVSPFTPMPRSYKEQLKV